MAGARSATLLTALSQALVAFTVEADNDYEEDAPHRTTLSRTGDGPWLTSMVSWTNGLRHIGDGVSTKELEQRARTLPNIGGLLRWGYLREDAGMLRLTAGGRTACESWTPIPDRVEARWHQRFGTANIERLRAALAVIAADQRDDLPDGMPILGHGMRSDRVLRTGPPPDDVEQLELPALLSRVLLALTLGYEDRSKISLAIATTVLRLLDKPGVTVAELPARSGIAKETVAVAVAWLHSHRLVDVGAGRLRLIEPTAAGQQARAGYLRGCDRLEAAAAQRWPGSIAEIRGLLTEIVASPRLAEGLVPPVAGWRSQLPYRRQTEAWLANPGGALPHFPVVTHRGGWPDGS